MSGLEGEPFTGVEMFRATARLSVPDGLKLDELRKALERLAAEIMVDLPSARARAPRQSRARAIAYIHIRYVNNEALAGAKRRTKRGPKRLKTLGRGAKNAASDAAPAIGADRSR